MLSHFRALETFLFTLLLTPAVALAQEVEYVGEPERAYGWGWGVWLIVGIFVVLALAGWTAARRRGGRAYP